MNKVGLALTLARFMMALPSLGLESPARPLVVTPKQKASEQNMETTNMPIRKITQNVFSHGGRQEAHCG